MLYKWILLVGLWKFGLTLACGNFEVENENRKSGLAYLAWQISLTKYMKKNKAVIYTLLEFNDIPISLLMTCSTTGVWNPFENDDDFALADSNQQRTFLLRIWFVLVLTTDSVPLSKLSFEWRIFNDVYLRQQELDSNFTS